MESLLQSKFLVFLEKNAVNRALFSTNSSVFPCHNYQPKTAAMPNSPAIKQTPVPGISNIYHPHPSATCLGCKRFESLLKFDNLKSTLSFCPRSMGGSPVLPPVFSRQFWNSSVVLLSGGPNAAKLET